MEILVRNAEGNVPEEHRHYAAKKLGSLDKYFQKASRVEMVHHEQKGKHRLQVTVFADEFTIRGEERDSSLRACIDRVADKLEKRLRSLKERLIDSHRRRGSSKLPEALATNNAPTREPLIMQRKQLPVKPMTPIEASLQLELVGHPFFVFENSETGKISVLYKRKGGSYGLLEPE